VAYSSFVQQKSQRLLRYAVERLGREELAARLKASPSDLTQWMEGRADMPPRKALTLADLIDHLDDRKRR
jgi:DNA-binding transcriptional regulator YdaS (Cro superfamily)